MRTKYTILFAVLVAALQSCDKKMEETKPIRKDVTETVFASGVLEADGTYNLTAQVDGYLTQINFKEGDTVKQGALLAIIDNKENLFNTQSAEALLQISKQNTAPTAPVLMQAKNEIQLAKQKMELDSLQAERYKRLLSANSIAKIDADNTILQYNTSVSNYKNAVENYKQLQQQAEQQLISSNTQKQVTNVLLNYNQLKAVVSGKVYEKYKQRGDFVKKGDVIALIGNAQFVYAKVNIDETNIAKVKLGQEAVVQLNTNKDKTYKASVAEIYPAFDDATQSFFCKLFFTDSLDFKITGTQLQSNIIIGVQKNALLIPRNYLDYGGNVMIKDKKDPVKVATGFVSNEWVQVLSGIDENTLLVTENLSANKTTTSEVGSQFR